MRRARARAVHRLAATAVAVAVLGTACGPPRPRLLVLLDRSPSMSLRDGTGASRLARGIAALRDVAPSWAERYDIEVRGFADDAGAPVPLDDLSEEMVLRSAEPGVPLADVGGAPDARLAAIVVITDGSYGEGALPALPGDVQTTWAGVGGPPPPHLTVAAVDGPDAALPGDTVTVAFDVAGDGELHPQAALLAPDGRPIEGTDGGWTWTVDGRHVTATRRFDVPGRYLVRAGVRPHEDSLTPHESAALHALHVDAVEPRVLYVEGAARWEYNYLKNALSRDAGIERVQVLLQDGDVADWGHPQRADTLERLDPALGLPGPEMLHRQDVVIVGDVDISGVRGPQFARALSQFVSDGGGLLLIAGTRHDPGAYRDTPLAELVPVVVDPVAEASDPVLASGEGFGFRLTAAGGAGSVMDVAGDAAASRELWEESPQWRQYWSYPTWEARPEAEVLAVSTEPRHRGRPLICRMPFGEGRVFYVGIDELWRMRRDVGDRYFYRFYGGVVRELARDRLLARADAARLQLQRAACLPGDDVQLTWVGPDTSVRVRRPDGGLDDVRSELTDDAGSSGYRTTETGLHHVELVGADGIVLQELPLVVGAPTGELADPGLNVEVLGVLAESSRDGLYVPLADLSALRFE